VIKKNISTKNKTFIHPHWLLTSNTINSAKKNTWKSIYFGSSQLFQPCKFKQGIHFQAPLLSPEIILIMV